MKLLIAIVGVIVIVRGNLSPENAYHITPVTNQPGLYYERVVTLRLQHVDWRVTTFIDVEKFLSDFPKEEEHIINLLERCREVTYNLFLGTNFPRGKCQELINSEHLLSRIGHAKMCAAELSTISHDSLPVKPVVDPMIRSMKRRSVPLGFIGSLSKSLFGTMNEEDAEYINGQIDRLFADQANLTHLIGKQMHLTRSKLQELHEEHVSETKRVDEMSKRIRALYKVLGGVTKDTAEVIFRIELVNYARRVEVKVDRYIEACGQYLRVITAARDGRYDPAVLSAAQLLAVSHEIQARTPEFEFPLSAEYLRGELLARVAHADLVFHGGRMLIVTHIPLLDRMNYILYRMHPWPVPQNDVNQTGSAHITPATDYIAVSADRRSYFLADSIYIGSCKHLEQKYICSMETPLHEVSTSEQCEAIMLNHPSPAAYRKCNIRIRPQHGVFWAHLPSQGGWLFSLNEREIIHILCMGNVEITTTLVGAGILRLSPNCVGRTRTTALTGIRTYESREQYFYLPDITLNISIMVPGLLNLSTTMALFKETRNSEKYSKGTSSWKTQEDGESLFEIEKRVREIGTHRRERQQQHSLFIVGFSVQAFLAGTLIIYFFRARAWNLISGLCAVCKKKSKPEEIKLKRRASIECGRGTQSSPHSKQSYRSPGTSRRSADSAVSESSGKDAVISSGAGRRDKTPSRSLSPQDPMRD